LKRLDGGREPGLEIEIHMIFQSDFRQIPKSKDTRRLLIPGVVSDLKFANVQYQWCAKFRFATLEALSETRPIE
jgi:hypothetical protein